MPDSRCEQGKLRPADPVAHDAGLGRSATKPTVMQPPAAARPSPPRRSHTPAFRRTRRGSAVTVTLADDLADGLFHGRAVGLTDVTEQQGAREDEGCRVGAVLSGVLRGWPWTASNTAAASPMFAPGAMPSP